MLANEEVTQVSEKQKFYGHIFSDKFLWCWVWAPNCIFTEMQIFYKSAKLYGGNIPAPNITDGIVLDGCWQNIPWLLTDYFLMEY